VKINVLQYLLEIWEEGVYHRLELFWINMLFMLLHGDGKKIKITSLHKLKNERFCGFEFNY
jgi:hypothetical protein